MHVKNEGAGITYNSNNSKNNYKRGGEIEKVGMGGGSSRGSPAKVVIDFPKKRRPSSDILYSPILNFNSSVSSPQLANTVGVTLVP